MSVQDLGTPAANPVIDRKKVDEAIVEATISIRGRVQYTDLPGGRIIYFSFTHSVKGGSVPVHVRASDPAQYKGQKITARAEIWKKKRANGVCEDYIDLYPVAGRATHLMCVTDTESIPPCYRTGRVRTHQVPKPMKGLIIFAAKT